MDWSLCLISGSCGLQIPGFFWSFRAQLKCYLHRKAFSWPAQLSSISDEEIHGCPSSFRLLFLFVKQDVLLPYRWRTFYVIKGKGVNLGRQLALTPCSLAVHTAKPQMELMSHYWLPITSDLIWISPLSLSISQLACSGCEKMSFLFLFLFHSF